MVHNQGFALLIGQDQFKSVNAEYESFQQPLWASPDVCICCVAGFVKD